MASDSEQFLSEQPHSERPTHSKPFEARWGGTRCAVCDDDIQPGEDVCYYEDELCHLDCVEDL